MACGVILRAALLALVVPAAAAGLNDFSNNLATDLGPLLSLFGEAITKQYLSESTEFTDYIIFALAPIGLMTAVVSVIRVCGDPWLRSFIGRAQEGDAAVEAELCTSTSKDICEVFNRGGITRTLGRAKILEVIRVPKLQPKTAVEPEEIDENEVDNDDNGADNNNRQTGHDKLKKHALKNIPATTTSDKNINWDWSEVNMGLFLVRDYLGKCKSSGWARWTNAQNPTWSLRSIMTSWCKCLSRGRKGKASVMEAGESGSTSANELPNKYIDINPNLSINIGIRRREPLFVYSVLVLGMTLQFGLIAMAPLLSWVGRWTTDGRSEKKLDIYHAYSNNKFPVLFVVGTILMNLGMFGCACLVGQITEERIYRRKNGDLESPERTKLYWVQAGNQVIGDQAYGPYAYSDSTHPLREYVISTKRKGEKTVQQYKIITWFTVIATLGGYVTQFVGLRGMSAWISITQLGAILVMSMFRGLLRTQRLADNGNKVQDISEEVVGHELDWLAFEIWKDMGMDRNRSRKTNMSWIFTGRSSREQPSPPNSGSDLNSAEEILQLRARLGYLSGHVSDFMRKEEKSQSQQWNEKDVPVRGRAMKMAKALSLIADRLIHKNQLKTKINLCFEIQFSRSPEDDEPKLHPIRITLHPPNLVGKRRGWSFDSLQLEAILGLYSWSFYRRVESDQSNHTFKPSVQSNSSKVKVGSPEYGLRARILSSRAATETKTETKTETETEPVPDDKQYLLDLWLGDNTPEIKFCTLNWNQPAHLTPGTLWGQVPNKEKIQFPTVRPEHMYEPLPVHTSADKTITYNGTKPIPSAGSKPLRFFGWSQAKEEKVDIFYVESEMSLLDYCCHDVFSAILSELVRLQSTKELSLVVQDLLPKPESFPTDWRSDILTDLINDFIKADMGNHQDALLCILPALHTLLKLPNKRDKGLGKFMAIRSAAEYRQRKQWLRSWRILRALDVKTPPGAFLQDVVVTSFCELFCSYIDSDEENLRIFGFKGLKWLQDRWAAERKDNNRELGPRLDALELDIPSITALAITQAGLTIYRYHFIAHHISTAPPRRSEDQNSLLPVWQEEPLQDLSAMLNVVDQIRNIDAIRFGIRFDFPSEYSKDVWDSFAAFSLLQGSPRNSSDGIWDNLKQIVNNFPDDLSRRFLTPEQSAESYCLKHREFGKTRIQLRSLLHHAKLDDFVKDILAPAAAANWYEIVQALLELGVPPGYREEPPENTSRGESPKDASGEQSERATEKKSTLAFDQCLYYNSADAARVLVQSREFEGYDRDIILGTATYGSDRVLRMMLELGLCKTYEEVPRVRGEYSEEPPLTTFGEVEDDPMTIATKRGHVKILKVLSELRGLSVHRRDMKGLMPVHHAASKPDGSFWTIFRELQDQGANLTVRDNTGMTPIMHMAHTGSLQQLELLFDWEEPIDIFLRDEAGKTVLYHLLSRNMEKADEGEKDTSVKLLKRMRSMGMSLSLPIGNYTPLMVAAQAGNAHLLTNLLSKDYKDYDDIQSSINNYGPRETTAVMFAAEEGREDAVKELLQQPDIELGLTSENGWTALSIASMNGHFKVVEMLLNSSKMEASLGARPAKASTSPSAESRESSSSTNTDFAIQKASMRGHVEIVKLLLEDGRIDPNVQAHMGNTALYDAAWGGKVAVIKELLSNKRVDPNAVTENGETPLHGAAYRNRVEAAELLLLDSRTQIDIRDHKGRTALDVAKEQNYKHMEEIIVKAMKKRIRESQVRRTLDFEDWALTSCWGVRSLVQRPSLYEELWTCGRWA